ncbi:MAG: hypothetical protein Q8942_04175 [Bacillota bacterium]|nr:hypothetical protein [Bacillota bacterium]
MKSGEIMAILFFLGGFFMGGFLGFVYAALVVSAKTGSERETNKE